MSYAFALKRNFMAMGEPVIWLRAMGQCPCFNTLTNSYDRTHALCGGTGVLRESVNVSQYKALVTGLNSRSRYNNKFGEIKNGDLQLSTWPNEINWAENDIFIVPSRTTTREEVITRGTGNSDTLSQPYVVSIERVFGLTAPIASGYSLQDSRVPTPGIVQWTANIPELGTNYAIRYLYCPRFVVVQGSILIRKPDPMGNPFPMVGQLRLMTLAPTDAQ